MKESVSYPQYRKYKNDKSFFRISSAEEFEEIQILGGQYTLHQFKAKILPDRNFIYDMTFAFEDNWVVITEEEYNGIRQKIKQEG
jgi:hypothetical protein